MSQNAKAPAGSAAKNAAEMRDSMKKQIIFLLACMMTLCMMGCGTKSTGISTDATGEIDGQLPNNQQENPEDGEQSSFLAKVISADGQMLLVEPLPGEWELRSADRIEVGVRDILTEDELAEISEGDVVQIIYDGYLLETYPARAHNTYDVFPKALGEVFDICYSSWYLPGQKNIYDTVGETIQKDLVTNGVASTDYTPDEETLLSIWNQIAELELLSIDREMTSAVLTDSDQVIGIEPCVYYEIQIRIGTAEYSIKGDATAHYYKGTDPQAAHFTQFVAFMDQVMKGTPEYQFLPEAVGAYE